MDKGVPVELLVFAKIIVVGIPAVAGTVENAQFTTEALPHWLIGRQGEDFSCVGDFSIHR